MTRILPLDVSEDHIDNDIGAPVSRAQGKEPSELSASLSRQHIKSSWLG
eukprot:COSAG02_NODE_1237_length_13725_cov_27.071921_13_plen_49_part_00